MVSTIKRHRISLGALLLVVLLGAALLATLGSQQGSAAPTSGTAEGSADSAQGFSVVKPATEKSLASLPPRAQLGISEFSKSSSEAVSQVGTVQLDSTSEVTVAVLESSMCVLGGRDGLASGTCLPVKKAIEGEGVSAGFCEPGLSEGDARLLGVVPDGIESVSVTPSGEQGKAETADVTSNVYEIDVPAVDSVVSGGDGSDSFEVRVPLATYAKGSGACEPR